MCRNIRNYTALLAYAMIWMGADTFVILSKLSLDCSSKSKMKMSTSTSSEEMEMDEKYKWVCHGVTEKLTSLNEAVMSMSGVTIDKANELIELGAVWVLDPNAEFEEYYENKRVKNDNRYVRQMEPVMLEEGVSLRIYPNAKRFTEACKQIDRDALLYEDTTFIVIDKPPMMPTQPDASNYFENVPGCVNQNLGPFTNLEGEVIERPLICHRVDSCVGGCVVLSKDRNGQSVFGKFQRERKVRKVYKAVTLKPVPTGMHIHWMWAAGLARGQSGGPSAQILSHNPEGKKKSKEWTRCVLEVTDSKPIDLPEDVLKKEEKGQQFFENTIRLVTGRKHQVRAQLGKYINLNRKHQSCEYIEFFQIYSESWMPHHSRHIIPAHFR